MEWEKQSRFNPEEKITEITCGACHRQSSSPPWPLGPAHSARTVVLRGMRNLLLSCNVVCRERDRNSIGTAVISNQCYSALKVCQLQNSITYSNQGLMLKYSKVQWSPSNQKASGAGCTSTETTFEGCRLLDSMSSTDPSTNPLTQIVKICSVHLSQCVTPPLTPLHPESLLRRSFMSRVFVPPLKLIPECAARCRRKLHDSALRRSDPPAYFQLSSSAHGMRCSAARQQSSELGLAQPARSKSFGLDSKGPLQVSRDRDTYLERKL